MNKPCLLFYLCHGHESSGAARAVTIANLLIDRFRVVILHHGRLTTEMMLSSYIEFVRLPAFDVNASANVIPINESRFQEETSASCRAMILEKYARLKPRVLIIEDYPFRSDSHGPELMPMIEWVRSGFENISIVISSVADVMAAGRYDSISGQNANAAVLNRYFDAVLVHSDPTFARLEEFFLPRDSLTMPVHHTGFVTRKNRRHPGASEEAAEQREQRVLVAGGDGRTSGSFYRTAVEAHRLLWDAHHLGMTLVTGELLPTEEWLELVEAAKELPALTVTRSVPDLRAELATVRWAVCCCGYDMMCDVIASRVSALFVPGDSRELSEQIDRAQRLVHWGASRLLMPHHLNSSSMASGIQQLMRFEPAHTDFQLNGAEVSANLIQQLSLGVGPSTSFSR